MMPPLHHMNMPPGAFAAFAGNVNVPPSVAVKQGSTTNASNAIGPALTGGASANTHTHSPSSKQKRPLPAGVSAKNSTLPTPTITMGANVLDEILGEASDLLNAAAEAQALGRLKMSNSYLKLAHPRLVGLGKRFDLVANLHLQLQPSGCSNPTNRDNHTNHNHGASALDGNNAAADEEDTNLALKLMSALLPNGVKVDKTMLEHLSKAAMAFHKKRSSGQHHVNNNLASTSTSGNVNVNADDEQAAGNHNASGEAAAISGNDGESNDKSDNAANNDGGERDVVWTDQEHEKCMAATNKGKDALYVASLLGTKTVTQVQAYLKQQQQNGKGGVSASTGRNRLKLGKEDVKPEAWKRVNRFNAREMILGGGIYGTASASTAGETVKDGK